MTEEHNLSVIMVTEITGDQIMSGGVVKLYRRALSAERFRQRRSHSVPLGIRSPHRRSAPTESDKGAPPSAALSPTPLGLLSPSLRPGTNPGPRSIRQQGM